MAVTLLTRQALNQDQTLWRLSWSSDLGGTPTFSIYIDGVLFLQTTNTSHEFFIAPGQNLQIEILDDSSAPAESYPDRVKLAWEPVDNAAKYRIEEFIDTEWVEGPTISDKGEGEFSHKTPQLADVTTHLFRVIPIEENGIEGNPRPFSVFMVRRPDRPSAEYEYDSNTAKITVTIS